MLLQGGVESLKVLSKFGKYNVITNESYIISDCICFSPSLTLTIPTTSQESIFVNIQIDQYIKKCGDVLVNTKLIIFLNMRCSKEATVRYKKVDRFEDFIDYVADPHLDRLLGIRFSTQFNVSNIKLLKEEVTNVLFKYLQYLREYIPELHDSIELKREIQKVIALSYEI